MQPDSESSPPPDPTPGRTEFSRLVEQVTTAYLDTWQEEDERSPDDHEDTGTFRRDEGHDLSRSWRPYDDGGGK